MKTSLKVLVILVSLFLIGINGTASASVFPVGLNFSNVSGDTGITYATVYGSFLNSTTFEFDVVAADGYKMRDFYFNTDIAGLTDDDITVILATGAANPSDYTADVNYDKIAADGFGKFDISVDKKGQHDITELKFDINLDGLGAATENNFFLLSDGNAGNGNGHFAVQILPPNCDDTFFARDGGTTKVPEPGTLVLLGSGLLGLGLLGRKKFRRQ